MCDGWGRQGRGEGRLELHIVVNGPYFLSIFLGGG